FVVNVQIALEVLDSGPDGRGIEDDIGERADVPRVEALAEVQPEAVVAGRARRFLQQSGKRRGCDVTVRIGEGRPVQPGLAYQRLGIYPCRTDRVEQTCRRGDRDH